MNGDLETGPSLAAAPQDPLPAAAPASSGAGPAHMRAVAREGGWAGVLVLAGAALRYVNTILLTRVLGPQLYGLYALANRLIMILSYLTNAGLPVSLVHFVAASAAKEEWGRLRWFLRAAVRATFFAGLAGAAVTVLLTPWAADAVWEKPGLVLPLAGLALALPLVGLYSIWAGGLQGLKDIRGKMLVERIAHPLLLTVLLLAGGFYFRSLPYVVACFFAATAVTAWFAWRRLASRLRSIPTASPAAPAWRELVSFSTPVLFLNLANYFILQSDVLVMGRFGAAAEVGVYAIAQTLASGVGMPIDSLGASLAPNFSAMVSREDREGLRRLFHTSTRWIFLCGSTVGLLLVFAAPLVLALFGKAFGRGYHALCILAVGQMFSASLGANGTLITMTGHPKVNLANAISMGLANLALNLYLVPRYGALGAASSAALSLIAVNLARSAEIWWLLKIGPWNRTMGKALLAFLLALGAGLAVLLPLHALGFWASALATLAVVCVYAGAWLLLGPEPEDWDMVLRAWGKLRRAKG